MAKSKNIVEDKIKFFINELEKHVNVETVVLFGSWVKGSADKFSDIDLAIFSPDFGKQRLKEAQLLSKVAWNVDTAIEAIPYSVDELKCEDPASFVYHIKKNGEVVFNKSKQKI